MLAEFFTNVLIRLTRTPIIVQRLLARAVAESLFLLSARRRAIARKNLQLCFPDLSERERSQLLRANCRAYASGFVDINLAWRDPKLGLLPNGYRYRVEGAEHLQSVATGGQGTIFLFPHLLHSELAARLLTAQTEMDMAAVYRPSQFPVQERFQRIGRENAGVACQIGRNSIRKAVTHLRAGGGLIYLPDQDYGGQKSVFAPFFGVLAGTTTVPFELARMTRSTFLMVAIYRDGDKAYCLEIQPLRLSEMDTMLERASKMNLEIERIIRRAPQDYLWHHRRFKRRPEGEPDLY